MKITNQAQAEAVRKHIESIAALRKVNIPATSDNDEPDDYRAALAEWEGEYFSKINITKTQIARLRYIYELSKRQEEEIVSMATLIKLGLESSDSARPTELGEAYLAWLDAQSVASKPATQYKSCPEDK